jgi:hypothetical protein
VNNQKTNKKSQMDAFFAFMKRQNGDAETRTKGNGGG